MEKKRVRVRFAPSPTGPLHIGGVKTALYNYLFAKHHGGDFLLRLEDTDQTRFVAGAEEYIVDALNWCGITIDEGISVGGPKGPYRQSERKPMYRQYADQLIANGKAYYAFDTSEDLDMMREQAKKNGAHSWQYNNVTRSSMKNSLTLSAEEVQKRMDAGEPFVIRFKMPRNHEVKFEDNIRGWVSVNTNNLDDKVLFKSDGMPTYHLANVVDDRLMEVSHMIRGEEWLPSAPLHVLLYDAFEWDKPEFAHLPLILKPNGKGKLSKRDGDKEGFPVFPTNWTDPSTGNVSSGYRESGYFPGAFLNMLALLGWNPGTPQEIFSLDELIQEFSMERVGKSGAKFDFDKTKWFNQQYLRATANDQLAAMLQEEVLNPKEIVADASYVASVCGIMKERATFVADIYKEGSYFFAAPTSYDEKTHKKKWKENTPEILTELRAVLEGLEDFTADAIGTAFKAFLEAKSLGFGAVMPNFRLAITGLGAGASMNEICELLGKEEVLNRMDTALAKL